MLALRLLAIIGLFALSTLPFAVAADEKDAASQTSEDEAGHPEEGEEEGHD